MNVLTAAFRKASIVVLLFSLPALFAAAVLVTGSTAQVTKLLRAFPIQLSFGLAGMLLLSWLAAPLLAGRCVRSLPVSGLFGIGVFVWGVLIASLSSSLLASDFSLYDYVLKPLFWVVPGGIVPAFILGVAGGVIARRAARSVDAGARNESSPSS